MADLRSLVQAGTGDADLVIRSNVTPEITIKLADVLAPGQPSQRAISSQHPLLMQLIKPEIIVKTLGVEKPYSPYGRPRAGMHQMIIVVLLSSGLIGALLAWLACHRFV